jgi:fatty-acyl-CoA synthase
LDAWFATGDLLSRDVDGFFFFQDRAGDSYRWKGHNVVSNEVAEVVAQFDQARVEECNVYGVTWPAQGEGRVGMACLLWREIDGDATATTATSSSSSAALLPASFDPRALLSYLRRSLPSHAVPAFLRLKLRGRAGVTANSATSTFKFHKHLCAKEGFDPTIIGQQGDIVLWWPGAMGRTNNNNSAAETDASSAEEQYEVLTEAEFKRITTPQQ